MSTSGSLPSGTARPSTASIVVTCVLPRGMRVEPPTDSTPGTARSRVMKLVEKCDLRSRRCLRRRRNELLEREQVRRVEAGIDIHDGEEAAQHEPGADREHHRERELGDDERARTRWLDVDAVVRCVSASAPVRQRLEASAGSRPNDETGHEPTTPARTTGRVASNRVSERRGRSAGASETISGVATKHHDDAGERRRARQADTLSTSDC